MNKTYITWDQVIIQTHDIIRQLTNSHWRPDYVVGLTRGGLFTANLISQYFDIPMEALKVSLREGDNGICVSDLGIAEDAYNGKKILIVDDINDTGATLNWIKEDWEGFHPSKSEPWKTIWGDTVRVAVLYDNEVSKSELEVKYSAVDINKAENDQWIVFPWEDWWKRLPI